MRIKSKLTQLKGPIPLWGSVVGSKDEGRMINEILFKDLTSHSLMATQWVPQASILDNQRPPVY